MNDIDWVQIGLGEGSRTIASRILYNGPISDLFDNNERNVIVEDFAREALAKQAGEANVE